MTTHTRASGHISLWLTAFPAEASDQHPFYVVAEDQSPGSFGVLGGAHVCNERASVRYRTEGGTATTSADFERRTGRAEFLITHGTSPVIVDVPIHVDGVVEAPLESFRVILSRPENGSLRHPSEAPFHVIDVDGGSRATLDRASYRVAEFDNVVRVAVFRAGSAAGALSVPFSVEPSGPGAATPGEDYTVLSASPITFGAGERLKVIEVGLSQDGVEEADETFDVVLADVPPDSIATTTVTIDGDVDLAPPRSRFHHPRDGWSYLADDFRIREMHVFTADGRGSGVVRVEMALRRNDSDGACAWWDGSRFVRGDCSQQRWLRMRAYEPGWFYYYRIRALRPSVGTGVRSYTAFAEATDSAGNIEESTIVGRNRNTFDVRRR
jgi:Calx-beta domain